MDKSIDAQFTERVKEQMNKYKLTNNTLALVLDISLKSTNDLMNNVSPWRLKYIVKVAQYFAVTTDYLIFGDNDHIEKVRYKAQYDIVHDIKDYLIREKKFQVYGKLETEGFFNILNKPKS